MQHYIAGILFFSLFLLQAAPELRTDYGGYIAPVVTVLLALVTVYSQIKQQRIKTELSKATEAHAASKDVMEGWKRLTEAQGQTIQNHSIEFRDMRNRMRQTEAQNRLCEKSHYKLVAQLIKNGIEIDMDKIFDDLHAVDVAIASETEIHTTKEKEVIPNAA